MEEMRGEIARNYSMPHGQKVGGWNILEDR